MDMSRVPQHVEDVQAFLELLCFSAIMLRSQMSKESIEISSILVKKEKIELLSKVKCEIIELPSKGKEEPKNNRAKGKKTYCCKL
jgi:hypothetical protein